MGTLNPSQMYDHELNPVKGWWDMHALDKRVEISDQNSVTVVKGMVGYLDPTTSKFLVGVVNGYMPMWAFQGENDFDANSDVGNISGGVLNCLVATGGYELETTEFVDGETYTPQVPLTGAAGADVGKLTPSANWASADQIVGVVSEDGPRTNDHGKEVVKFWPVFNPSRA